MPGPARGKGKGGGGGGGMHPTHFIRAAVPIHTPPPLLGPCCVPFFPRASQLSRPQHPLPSLVLVSPHLTSAAAVAAAPVPRRFIEFYNMVFMELNRSADGTTAPLANKNIDTGMGLERMAQILQVRRWPLGEAWL